MEVRAELKYTKSHEWVKEEGGVWTIGLTDYAQSALGDLVFVNLPEAGDSVEAGEVFGDVESVKAVSDVYSPVTGEVEEINEELLDAPEKINGALYCCRNKMPVSACAAENRLKYLILCSNIFHITTYF